MQSTDWFTLVGAKTLWPPLWSSSGEKLYVILVYLVVSLPASDLFVEDKNLKLHQIYRSKSNRGKYAFSHYFTCFISGGLAGIFPLLIASYIIFMTVPATGLHPLNMTNFQADRMIQYALLIENFPAYFLLIQARCFLGCGFISIFAMAVNNYVKSTIAGYLGPMIITSLINNIGFFEEYMLTNIPISVARLLPSTWVYILVILVFILIDYIRQRMVRDLL